MDKLHYGKESGRAKVARPLPEDDVSALGRIWGRCVSGRTEEAI